MSLENYQRIIDDIEPTETSLYPKSPECCFTFINCKEKCGLLKECNKNEINIEETNYTTCETCEEDYQ